MAPINVVAIMTPAPGKEDRLKSLIGELTTKVHDNEPNVSRYMATEAKDKDGLKIVFIEQYQDEEANKRHVGMPHFKSFFKSLQSEGLLATAPQILRSTAFSGYDLGRSKL